MPAFDNWPARANGDRVTASWWNVIRTWAMGYVGQGAISETQFTIANNQSSAASVTGLSVAAASYHSIFVEYHIVRGAVSASGQLVAIRRVANSLWEIVSDEYYGDSHGVTFAIDDTGQFTYTSTNAAAGTMRFRARSFNVAT